MTDIWTEAMQEALASAPVDVIILHTLEIRHPAFTAPIRVVRDTSNPRLDPAKYFRATLEVDAPANPGEQVSFMQCWFDFVLPAAKENEAPQLQIEIDNVDRQIVAALELASTQLAPIEVTYRPFLSTDTGRPHMNPPLTMTLSKVTANVFRVTGSATMQDFHNLTWPSQIYTAKRFPGLVRT